jgi:hypothetical protein
MPHRRRNLHGFTGIALTWDSSSAATATIRMAPRPVTSSSYRNRNSGSLTSCTAFQRWCTNELEPTAGIEALQVFENMVARDGIEPPTPAFSGLAPTVANLLILLCVPQETPTKSV